MTQREASSCTGKIGYIAFDHAKHRLTKSRRRLRKRKKARADIYRCPHCRHWHIGANYHDAFQG